MAKKEEKKDKEEEDGANSGPPIMKIVIIAVVLSMLLGGGLVGGTFFFVNKMNEEKLIAEAESAEGESAAPTVPPEYHSMDPKFVVSFNSGNESRFMQFSVDIMTRDSEMIEKIDEHMPVIRSSLLMLFGSQDYNAMLTREGKEKLLEEVATDINTTLQKVSGSEEMVSAIEEAYFTSFVIQ
jgi:flagellar FliL protein